MNNNKPQMFMKTILSESCFLFVILGFLGVIHFMSPLGMSSALVSSEFQLALNLAIVYLF